MSKKYHQRINLTPEQKKGLNGYSELLQKILVSRGIENKEEAQKFFSFDYQTGTHDPSLLLNIDKAVNRIWEAIKNDEKILIFTDYDADGIPSAVIMHDFFSQVEAQMGYNNIEFYIPHRNKEGFGLSERIVTKCKEKGFDLVITCDCGSSDNEHVERLQKNGTDVIITDHHEVPDPAPNAYAIVNPKQKECKYPEKMLCACAVVFKLIQVLVEKGKKEKLINLPDGYEKLLLDMVGISTLSDMVPLMGENRLLAHYGLVVLRKSKRIGLQKLIQEKKLDQRFLTETDIVFSITPSINAASRMDVPDDAFDLLKTRNDAEAGMLVEKLQKANESRKGFVAAMVREIHEELKEKDEIPNVIVAGNPDWKPSLLGLAANSIMEEHHRPVFLWGRGEADMIKGSCRAPDGVSVVDLMHESHLDGQNLFDEHGGHNQAGGFSLSPGQVAYAEKSLNEAFDKLGIGNNDLILYYDQQITLDDINWDTYQEISQCAPFGTGNETPKLFIPNIQAQSVQKFGKTKNHTKLIFENSKGEVVEAICFFKLPDDLKEGLDENTKFDLVAELEAQYFMGKQQLRLRIVDIL